MEKTLFGLNLNNDMIDGVKGEIANFGVEFAGEQKMIISGQRMQSLGRL